jgi:hypothetical protein
MSVYCNFRISRAYSAYLSIFDILCILIIFLFVTARIDDGEESDDWEVKDHRTGESVPLRADRWFQKDPSADPAMSSGDFSGIRINIWNRAKVRRFITHFLAGGGTHNRGYHALRWEMILHGNAGEMGKYAVLSVLPDKIARFLYEYHDTSYTSLGLPPIPLDRSGISVHGILRPDQVHLYDICITCKI